MTDRLETRAMLERAARAVGKIDLWGPRGLTGLSTADIEAIAGALVALGLIAIPPGATAPETLIVEKRHV